MKNNTMVVSTSTRYASPTVDPINPAATNTVATPPWTSSATYGVRHRGSTAPNAGGSTRSTPATKGIRADPAIQAPAPPRLPSVSSAATSAGTITSHPPPSRSTIAAAACGTPFVRLTASAGNATRIASVPSTYVATMPTPDHTMPRRSVAAGSRISPPSVGANSSPANANVIVAKRLSSERSSLAGRNALAENVVALPWDANETAARATKIAAGTHVPYAPRFCTHLPTRRPTKFSPSAIHSMPSENSAMNHLLSASGTNRGPPTYAAIAAEVNSSEG